MNLFQVARDNSAAFSRRYGSMRGAADAAAALRLDRFVAAVERDGRLAVNLRPTVLLRFLVLGMLHNLYEWTDELARLSGRPREELLRAQLKTWYDRRMTFDRFLDDGERLRYGALNLGGLGTAHFGEYCLVFQEAFTAWGGELAWLWADSLETYLLPGGAVDEARLRRDACPHTHRQFLAALKHETDLAAVAEEEWPALVASSRGFIEAIFLARPLPEDLQAVRMERSDFERYTDLVVDAFLGQLTEVDRHRVEELDTILRLLDERSIPVEKVAA